MTEDKKKEILKACHYGYTHDVIAVNCKVTEDEVRKVIEDNLDYLEELEARKYD